MNELGAFLPQTNIAYFTMELALRVEVHTYAGGLGVLAGDTVRSCADLELPVVFVTLMSRAGYFRQEIVEGRQIEHPDPWDINRWAQPLAAMIGVQIEGRDVWVRPWLYVHKSDVGYAVPVLLLDTDLEQNDLRDRDLTHYLYGGDEVYRLKQELLLGVGGVRILEALGFDIGTYHLNEGHAAFATV
ncbi:MAG: glycogen phosphorylase, partial [Betaproteobacteria bacterium]